MDKLNHRIILPLITIFLLVVFGYLINRTSTNTTINESMPVEPTTGTIQKNTVEKTNIPQNEGTNAQQSEQNTAEVTDVPGAAVSGVTCNLPCLDNITPGRTTWTDAFNLLSDTGLLKLLESGTTQSESGDKQRFEDYRVISNSGSEKEVFLIGRKEDIVSYISLENPQPQDKYTFRNFLMAEGIPAQVFFTTVEGELGGFLPGMTIILSYDDKNFLAIYTTIQDSSDVMISGCFNDGPIIDIYSSNKHLTPDFLKKRIGDEEFDHILTTTDAFGLSIEGFYDYIIENGNNCVQTKTSLWQ